MPTTAAGIVGIDDRRFSHGPNSSDGHRFCRRYDHAAEHGSDGNHGQSHFDSPLSKSLTSGFKPLPAERHVNRKRHFRGEIKMLNAKLR
jgi:hypothetical protein